VVRSVAARTVEPLLVDRGNQLSVMVRRVVHPKIAADVFHGDAGVLKSSPVIAILQISYWFVQIIESDRVNQTRRKLVAKTDLPVSPSWQVRLSNLF
jgi:hypothetical protein